MWVGVKNSLKWLKFQSLEWAFLFEVWKLGQRYLLDTFTQI